MWTSAVIKFAYISYKICLVTKSSIQKNSLRTKHKHIYHFLSVMKRKLLQLHINQCH